MAYPCPYSRAGLNCSVLGMKMSMLKAMDKVREDLVQQHIRLEHETEAKEEDLRRRIKQLEHEAAVAKLMDYKSVEFDDAKRVLRAAGLSEPVPEAIEQLIAEVAKLKAEQ